MSHTNDCSPWDTFSAVTKRSPPCDPISPNTSKGLVPYALFARPKSLAQQAFMAPRVRNAKRQSAAFQDGLALIRAI